jgi:alpha-galactosidase
MPARGLRVLLAIAALPTLLGTAAAADDLVGIWLPQDATPEILEREPGRLRVLVVKQSAAGELVAKLVVPTLAGMPISVRREGGRIRFVLQMARGMDQPFEARLADGHLLIGDPGQQPVPLRRPTPEEARILERLTPKPLPLPAPTALPPNGLAKTPPMGFSTWNHFAERIDDRTVREIADALVSTGMRDAGYVSVNIDDGWQGTRDANGEIRPNAKFPDMKALADYVHAKGLKLGIYTSPGSKSCAGFEGSYGHEEQDAKTFAAWGVDYLKYDWCSAGLIYDDADMPAVYQKMALALRATGRPMVYSLCQYGRNDVWTWGAAAGGNLWRTTGDIGDRWEVMSAIGFEQGELSPFAGPGHWNDPDMLEVGNGGMTTPEYRTHMSLWAMLAAPLIAGHDVRKSSPETLALLLNRGVIAIDQDPLGRAGKRVVQRGPLEIWTRPLDGGRTAVALFNRGETPARVEAALADVGLAKGSVATDVWAGHALPALDDRVAADVEPHGVVLLVVTPPGGATAAAAASPATTR